MSDQLLVFYVETGDGDEIAGYATTNGFGLTEALDALVRKCFAEEMTGAIDLTTLGATSLKPCIQLGWDDVETMRVYDIAGRSHALMVGGRSLADIVTDAVMEANEDAQ